MDTLGGGHVNRGRRWAGFALGRLRFDRQMSFAWRRRLFGGWLLIALLGTLALASDALAPAAEAGTHPPAVQIPVAAAASSSSGLSIESENPINDQGSNYNYRSYITSITPKVPGLSVEVLEFADRLLMRNNTGKTVTVYGYSGEPYARVQPDGAAELNMHAPAVYLNTNFYAEVTVPPYASPSARPKWEVVDRAGQFEWHDHRIHYMSPALPLQVKNTSKRTKIFNWSVPISVGTQRGAIDGELYWVPENSHAPAGAIVALVAILLAGATLVVVVRRRRARAAPPGAGAGADAIDRPPPPNEAW
jgi:hypothetical protein